MSDDRSRPGGGALRPGNVGRADPHADPATDPSLRPAEAADPAGGPTLPVPADPSGGPTVPVRIPDQEGPAPDVESPARPSPGAAASRSRLSGLWVGLILSAVVLLLLLIFILQNLQAVDVHFLGASGRLPTGVALLFAAVAGVLLVAIPGSLRILQLRRAARRSRSGRTREAKVR